MSEIPSLASITVLDILEDFPEMAFIYRSDGLLMAMNGVCERLLGVPRELVIGRFNLHENEQGIPPALMAGYRAAFAGHSQIVQATEIKIAESNSLGIEVNRAVRWVETMLTPMHRGPDGAAAYVLGIQRDVSELLVTREEIAAARATIGIQKDTITSLEAARREIEAQKATIQALSTPVIEVWEGIITLPLLGHFNAERASATTSQLLDAVVSTRARYAILDLTGLAVIDTTTGDHILRIVNAVGLLGATGVLVGIQAAIAQLLVGLGVDLQRVRVYQNLRQALKACMSESRA
jgi:rsbT co-antagonist protein RsbR